VEESPQPVLSAAPPVCDVRSVSEIERARSLALKAYKDKYEKCIAEKEILQGELNTLRVLTEPHSPLPTDTEIEQRIERLRKMDSVSPSIVGSVEWHEQQLREMDSVSSSPEGASRPTIGGVPPPRVATAAIEKISKIHIGSTEQDVLRILGSPYEYSDMSWESAYPPGRVGGHIYLRYMRTKKQRRRLDLPDEIVIDAKTRLVKEYRNNSGTLPIQ